MKLPLIMHINCCEQGQTIDDACRKCAELGFDGIEFRRKRSRVARARKNTLIPSPVPLKSTRSK